MATERRVRNSAHLSRPFSNRYVADARTFLLILPTSASPPKPIFGSAIGMSALGRKQTCAVREPISAGPEADICLRTRASPLYPPKADDGYEEPKADTTTTPPISLHFPIAFLRWSHSLQ